MNKDEAKWDSKAAQSGRLDARYRLLQDQDEETETYAQYENKKIEYVQFAKEVVSSADKVATSGDPMTELTLGLCIYNQHKGDVSKAFTFFTKATQAGIPSAQEWLGSFYEGNPKVLRYGMKRQVKRAWSARRQSGFTSREAGR